VTPGIQELMREVERVRDGFRRAVLAGEPDAAVALCADAVTLVGLPVGAGATGREAVREHLAHVGANLPADLTFARVSRTVDRFRVVDEERVSFTHDRELPWLLPGVGATGRRAEVLAISVATVRQGRLLAVRTLWDHTTLLAGLGVPAGAVQPVAVALPGGEGPRGWW
jgi:carboxymethylenebutenolidase